MLVSLKQWKIWEVCENKFIIWYLLSIGIASKGQFEYVLTTYNTENYEILKLTLLKCHAIVIVSLQHVKYWNTCNYMANCVYLHYSSIIKFDFMN